MHDQRGKLQVFEVPWLKSLAVFAKRFRSSPGHDEKGYLDVKMKGVQAQAKCKTRMSRPEQIEQGGIRIVRQNKAERLGRVASVEKLISGCNRTAQLRSYLDHRHHGGGTTFF